MLLRFVKIKCKPTGLCTHIQIMSVIHWPVLLKISMICQSCFSYTYNPLLTFLLVVIHILFISKCFVYYQYNLPRRHSLFISLIKVLFEVLHFQNLCVCAHVCDIYKILGIFSYSRIRKVYTTYYTT